MKKLILLALVLFSAATMLAQTNRMSYQAVVRNAANELVAEENLTVAIRISDANSTSAFSETHSVTSNRNGVISLMIGEGSSQSGNMMSVDWRTAQIHTVITLPGGATLSNTTPVNAVPYAFYADSVDVQWVSDVVDDYLEHHSISSIVETDPTVPDWAKESTKPAYDYSEIANTPDLSGYLTVETDPTVPDWAKETTKPAYDYSEIVNTPDLSGYLTGYTETQTLADVTAQGNSAGNRQLKNVSDPTDPQDAVTKAYLDQLVNNLTGLVQNLQQQLDSLQNVVDSLTGGSTTVTQPTVTTSAATNITSTSATLNGSVSNPDNVVITAQGFEWKTTTGGAYVAVNATGETMTYNLTSLAAGTGYTYRAFVTTAEGTAYGSEVSFTTEESIIPAVDAQPCPGTPTVTDHEGNVYNTVQIGTQCWMKENLRTTTSPSTGTYLIPAAGTVISYTGKQARWYNNDSATYAPMNYGLLYNWNAAVDTFNTAYGETSVNIYSDNAVSVTLSGHRRGICPAGWHLPSNAEWNTMERTVSGSDWQTNYETYIGYRGSHAGKLAGGDNWETSTKSGAPGDYSNVDRNVSGFSAVPAGDCDGSSFSYAGNNAYFWSASGDDSNIALYRSLLYNSARVNKDWMTKYYGYSVRCLRD